MRRHFRSDDLAIAIVTRDAEAFRDALLANDLSPPTYNTAATDEIMAEDEAIMTYELSISRDRVRIVPVEEIFREAN